MCGKRMKKFTRRSWGLDQPSEASVLTRWETNADLPVSMLRFLSWFWKCMPSLKTNSSSRYVHVDRGLTVAYMDPTVQNGLWPCRWSHILILFVFPEFFFRVLNYFFDNFFFARHATVKEYVMSHCMTPSVCSPWFIALTKTQMAYDINTWIYLNAQIFRFMHMVKCVCEEA